MSGGAPDADVLESSRTRGAVGRGLLGSIGASIWIQLLNVVTGVLLARQLGPEGRGELAAVLIWPTMLALVGSLGLTQASTYLAARGRTAGGLAASGAVLAAAQSALLIGIGLLLLPVVLDRYDDETLRIAQLYLLYIPVNLVTLYLAGIVNGLQRFGWFQVLRLLVIAATAIPLVALASAGELRVGTAVGVYLAANLLTGIVAAAMVAAAGAGRLQPSRQLIRELLGFGVRSHTSTLSTYANERLDQLVISVALSPAFLGLYVVAVTLNAATALIGASVALVALPALAREVDAAERAARARDLVSLTLLGSLAIAVPMLALAPQLVELFFGPDFAGAVDAARALLVAGVAYGTGRVLEATLQAVGRPLDAGLCEGAALLVTAAGLALLLPGLEILGAGLASLAAYSVSAGLMTWRAARALQLNPLQLLVPERGAIRRLRLLLRSVRTPVAST